MPNAAPVMAESQPRKREDFTAKDDILLYKYMATHNPRMYGRSGNLVFEHLCKPENACKWSFAGRHPWQSWQNRYKKDKEWFDKKIKEYQTKKNIDPYGNVGYPRQNPGPGSRSQHDNDVQEAETSSPPAHKVKKASATRQKTGARSKRRRDSFEADEMFEDTTTMAKKGRPVKYRVVASTPGPSSLPQPLPKRHKVDHAHEETPAAPTQENEPQDTRAPTPSQDNLAPPSDMDYQGDIYPQDTDSESQKREPLPDKQESTHGEETSSEEEVTPGSAAATVEDHMISRKFLFDSSQAKSTQDPINQNVELIWPPIRQPRNAETSVFSHNTGHSGSLQQEPTPPASDAPEVEPVQSPALSLVSPPGQPRHLHTTRNTRPPQLHEGPYTSAFTDAQGRTRLSKSGRRSGAVLSRPSLLPNNDFAAPADADADIEEEEVEQALRPEVSFGIFSQDPEEDNVIPTSGCADISGSGSQAEGNTSLMRHMFTPGLSEEPEAVAPVAMVAAPSKILQEGEEQDEDELLYEAEDQIQASPKATEILDEPPTRLRQDEEATLFDAQAFQEYPNSRHDDEVTRLNIRESDEDEDEMQAKERNSWLNGSGELRKALLAPLPSPYKVVLEPEEVSLAPTQEVPESPEQSPSSSSRVLHGLNRSYSASTIPLPSPSSKLVSKMTLRLERTRPPEPSPLKIASPPRRASLSPYSQRSQAFPTAAEDVHPKIESPQRTTTDQLDAQEDEADDESRLTSSPHALSNRRASSSEFEEPESDSGHVSPRSPPRQSRPFMRLPEPKDYVEQEESEVEIPIAETSRQGRARENLRRRSNVSFADEVDMGFSQTRQSASSRSRRRSSLSNSKYEELTRRMSSRSSVFVTSNSSGSIAASIFAHDAVPDDTSDVQMSTQAEEVALSVGKEALIRHLCLVHGQGREMTMRMLAKCGTWEAADRKLRRMREAAELIAAEEDDDEEG